MLISLRGDAGPKSLYASMKGPSLESSIMAHDSHSAKNNATSFLSAMPLNALKNLQPWSSGHQLTSSHHHHLAILGAGHHHHHDPAADHYLSASIVSPIC